RSELNKRRATVVHSRHQPMSAPSPGSKFNRQGGSNLDRRQHHLPSKALTERVRRQFPQLEFEFHHPAWYLLRNPALSADSVRRLVGQMPKPWRERLKSLDKADIRALRIGGGLVEVAALGSWSFLDAVLLFECLRRKAEQRADEERLDALIAILYGLPLLYCDDSVWSLVASQTNDAQHELGAEILEALDAGLELDGQRSRGVRFPVDKRLLALGMQWHEVMNYKRKHSRALRERRTYRNYLEEGLNTFSGSASSLARTAFTPAGSNDVMSGEWWVPPIDERLWVWALQTPARGPWRRYASREDIDEAWNLYRAEKAGEL
ncbi:hypothetical protein, partial [Roseateles flavus]